MSGPAPFRMAEGVIVDPDPLLHSNAAEVVHSLMVVICVNPDLNHLCKHNVSPSCMLIFAVFYPTE